MHASVVLVSALGVCSAFQVEHRGRILRRNDSVTYPNTTFPSTTLSDALTSSLSPMTLSQDPSDLSSATTYGIQSDSIITANVTTEQSRSTLFPSSDATATYSACINTVVTYSDAVPPTVFITIDSSYEVAGTDNPSRSHPTIYETPPPPCSTVIVSGSSGAAETGHIITASAAVTHNVTHRPEVITGDSFTLELGTLGTAVTQPTFNGLRMTTTVLVTKKTPVPRADPISTNPPVTFEMSTNPTQGVAHVSSLTTESNNGQGSPGGGNNNQASSQGNNDNNNNNLVPGLATTTSAITPLTTEIAGVGVSIQPSSIVVGGQTVAVPQESSQTTIVAQGQTFTIYPSRIVAQGTTVDLANQVSASAPVYTTSTQPASIVTEDGLTITVGPSIAVISGTTYRIGISAQPTTITVDQQTISIGTNGLGFLGHDQSSGTTTFYPAMTIAGDGHGHSYEVVAVDGLTVSIDLTDAVVGGTTYHVGSAATGSGGIGTTMTTIIEGQTVYIGPAGVAISGTTITPTSVPFLASTEPTSTSQRGGTATSIGVTATSTGSSHAAKSANAAKSYRQEMASWVDVLVWGFAVPFALRTLI